MPKHVALLFWEFDLDKLDIQKHKSFIIERILEKGTFDSVKWMLSIFTVTELKNILSSSPNLSVETQDFWKTQLKMI